MGEAPIHQWKLCHRRLDAACPKTRQIPITGTNSSTGLPQFLCLKCAFWSSFWPCAHLARSPAASRTMGGSAALQDMGDPHISDSGVIFLVTLLLLSYTKIGLLPLVLS